MVMPCLWGQLVWAASFAKNDLPLYYGSPCLVCCLDEAAIFVTRWHLQCPLLVNIDPTVSSGQHERLTFIYSNFS